MSPTGLLERTSSSRLSRLADEQVAEFARAGCPQATEYLLRKYRGFVEGKARSYFLTGAEQDDVVQEGMIGLYKAIRDFQAGKLTHFRSFAELCITRQIITAVKSATRFKHSMLTESVSLDATRDEDGGSLMDVIADSRVGDPERILMEKHTIRCLRSQTVEDLSDLEREVLRGYLNGRSYIDMATVLRRPAKTVDNALQRAKRKVGQKLMELN